ncbi:hypothetical protein D7T48_02855 [Stenotrophomonas maltophilia]|uniref:hypothetical protein n=1 Tax=Stenotrophomonas TaxID=40323 RepID=UPI000D0BA926|nr:MULTISPECIES: hypothetical protein [Stenotrophomonas]HBK51551.1 hypothetical protein [Pseudomonas sp.]AVO30620.1 hypothetical protein C6Y55_12130 [Stenotrophomonas maltophilia]ELC7320757.1 hypothetical protein [Stenotrophomonas maltophilia]ELC7324811.1 hypothetical protein [Stenotrophomonas maltophilia]MBA0275312.1 hypothetical protein [Stenotrophomonas maltophilia]
MNASEFPHQRAPANADEGHDIPPDPNNLTALLHRIGLGAASDGQPWPERHQLPGRCMALADADGALAGLRVVQEILLAAERARQNGGPEHYVGDRVMEGLKLAALALTSHAIYRLHPE